MNVSILVINVYMVVIQGDSLGNLVLLKNRLFGLVSVDCSRRSPESPVVFIKTAIFSKWINSIMCRVRSRAG